MRLSRGERVTLTALGLTALLALAILIGQRARGPLTIDGASSAMPTAEWKGALAFARQLDVNTASASAFQRLPGIGPVLAERIVAYRTEHGVFHDLRELERVKGIGPNTLEAIEAYVTVR